MHLNNKTTLELLHTVQNASVGLIPVFLVQLTIISSKIFENRLLCDFDGKSSIPGSFLWRTRWVGQIESGTAADSKTTKIQSHHSPVRCASQLTGGGTGETPRKRRFYKHTVNNVTGTNTLQTLKMQMSGRLTYCPWLGIRVHLPTWLALLLPPYCSLKSRAGRTYVLSQSVTKYMMSWWHESTDSAAILS